MRLGGWTLVGWTALVVGALSGALLALHGSGDDGIGAVLRATARSSALLFSAAFAASSLHRLLRRPWTRQLLANRRYLGVSVGVSHTIHLAAIAVWLSRSDEASDWIGLAIGATVYAFLAAMVATSFDRSAAWLGPRRWRRLHTTGGHAPWLVFIYTFATGAVTAPDAAGAVDPGLYTALLAAVLVLRLYSKRWRPQPSRACG